MMGCLRNVSSSDLQNINSALALNDFAGLFYWVPVIDGTFIADSPTSILLSGRKNGVIVYVQGMNALIDQTIAKLQRKY